MFNIRILTSEKLTLNYCRLGGSLVLMVNSYRLTRFQVVEQRE